MKERPILFSAPMVRAILAGTKTQTRRAWPVQPPPGVRIGWVPGKTRAGRYGKPGDRLWVRETWYCDDYRVQRGPYIKPDDMNVDEAQRDGTLVYRASSGDRPYEAEQPIWRPSIHMPRWASRITLEVTAVRVERLQNISEPDAQAEGIVPQGDGGWALADTTHYSSTAVSSYCSLWESINGPGSWGANPWVWVVEFKRQAERSAA